MCRYCLTDVGFYCCTNRSECDVLDSCVERSRRRALVRGSVGNETYQTSSVLTTRGVDEVAGIALRRTEGVWLTRAQNETVYVLPVRMYVPMSATVR